MKLKLFSVFVVAAVLVARAAAITATAFAPAPGSTGVCTDTLLTVTFDVTGIAAPSFRLW